MILGWIPDKTLACFDSLYPQCPLAMHPRQKQIPAKRRFSRWAILGSNQCPLLCKGSTIISWRFLEFAKLLQIALFLQQCFS